MTLELEAPAPAHEITIDEDALRALDTTRDPVYDFAQKFWAWVDNNWTDYVFAVGGLTFFVGLLPILLTPAAAVPLTSSIPTAAALWLFLGVYSHLRLRFSFATGTLSAISWTLIAILRGI